LLASLFLSLSGISHAQVTTNITPSGGLGTTLNGGVPACTSNCTITGGTRPGNGPNLFHSFGNFSVGDGHTANFLNRDINNNPGPLTTNILSRVTGGATSNIFGTIQTTDFGNANLFLINPAGVVFGPSASLDIGGSFHVSTADYVRLFDGTNSANFYASPASDGLANSVLSSAPPVDFGFLTPAAFGFTRSTPAAITIDNSFLSVPAGQTLSVVGGDITVTGGTLNAPGGPINLTSVAGAGEVTTDTAEPAAGMALGTITLDQNTLSTVGDFSFGDGSGGAVSIRGGQLVATGATITTSAAEGSGGSGGAVAVSVSDSASLTDVAILTNSISAGGAGAVSITADNGLTATNAFIDSSAVSALGDSGPVTLTSNGPLSMTDSTILTFSDGSGNAGPVSLTGDLLLSNVLIATGAFFGGNAGSVTLTGLPNVSLVNGFGINADVVGDGTTASRPGAVTLTAADGTVTLSGLSIFESFISTTASDTLADGSSVKITGATVNLLNGAIDVFTSNDVVTPSSGGDIEIRGEDVSLTQFQLRSGNVGTPQSIGTGGRIRFLDAENIRLTASDVSTNSTSGGGAGAIEFHTQALKMSELASVSSVTFGSGPSGTITVIGAENVTLESGSLVTTETVAQGPAGNILFETQQLTISGGGLVLSSALPLSTGNAGSVTVQGQAGAGTYASAVLIDGSSSGIFTNTQGTGAGGNLTLNAKTVTLQNSGTLSAATSGTAASATGGTIAVGATQVQLNGATITASSSGPANAGNIAVTATDSLVMQNGSISTQTALSDGGNITIHAGRLVQLTDSRITTSVQGGLGNGGNITIDPQFVILQNSQIIANAFGGNGGNILIVAGLFLADSTSTVSASSTFGLSGTVNIQATVTNLSESLSPLSGEFAQAAELLRARCAARFSQSSLVLAGRDGVPSEPGGRMPSPLFVEGPRLAHPAMSMNVPSLQVGRVWSESAVSPAALDTGCAS